MSTKVAVVALAAIQPGMTLEQAKAALPAGSTWHEPRTGVAVAATSIANTDGVVDVVHCNGEVTRVVFEAMYHARASVLGQAARDVGNTVADSKLNLDGAEVIPEGYVQAECNEQISEKAAWIRCTQTYNPWQTAGAEYDRMVGAYQAKYGESFQKTELPPGPVHSLLDLPHKSISHTVHSEWRLVAGEQEVVVQYACSAPVRPLWCGTIVRLGEAKACTAGI